MNMVKYENVRRYVIYESNVPKLCLYHLSLVTKSTRSGSNPNPSQLQRSSVWHPSAFAIEIRNFQIGPLPSIYHIYSHIFTYHHFISPPPNKIQPSPSVTKSEYFMTSSCSGLLPCHPMSLCQGACTSWWCIFRFVPAESCGSPSHDIFHTSSRLSAPVSGFIKCDFA